ncbi:MAG: glucuronate isomerase [Ignavibacteria bacterium]|nr:glucuronate isomerase [Ignavibacteria bacterium]
MQKLELNEDRFFDAEPSIRKNAREIYSSICNLPIISPHGHVDPNLFVENKPFTNPTELFLIPDHYVFRMFYSQGIPLENLGIPTADGSPVETDPRKIWQIFAENFYLFRGTPSGVWLDYEFNKVFGIEEKLVGGNAQKIYDELNEKLHTKEFLPRNLFDSFNIKVLTTTDTATDPLEAHRKIRESGWQGNVIPSFRPDSVTDLNNPSWNENIKILGKLTEKEITGYKQYIAALENRREYFKSLGATSTDHGLEIPYMARITEQEAEKIFQKALAGKSDAADAKIFTAHMIMEMGRMSCEDGLVMMVHAGCLRNHNKYILKKFGPDKGADIPVQAEYVRNMQEFLNAYGNDPRMTVIVFTLDESVYSRELAPFAGHYPAMKLGPAWWFHDSIEGMTRYRQLMTETGGFYNTVGFIDDTRAFVSIPARHDVARRIDSNFLGNLVARHIISMDEALKIAYELTNGLVKKSFKFNI